MESLNKKGLTFILTLVLAVILCGAVSAATTTSYSANGKIIKITSDYGTSTLQSHVSSKGKKGTYGEGIYTTQTFSGKDIKGRIVNRTINYFDYVYKYDSYKVYDHSGFEYYSQSKSDGKKITGTIIGKLSSGIIFSGTITSPFYYLNKHKLVKNSTGVMNFWQNGKFLAKINFLDTYQYKLFNADYQLIKLTETTNTFYANGDTRSSVISSYYTRSSKGTLTGQKTSGTSKGTEKINNKKVSYTGKITITTRYDPKDVYNEKFDFGNYYEDKTSTSPNLLKTYPFEAINFS
jgi:hypothetical protein